MRWARFVDDQDVVLTFNYDTLVERVLAKEKMAWNHGTGRDGDKGIPVYKLHGSIDWIVAHRRESFREFELLFEKQNANQPEQDTGHVEDDCRLWRCRTREQLKNWISGRDLQLVHRNAAPRTVGIAGLGAFKELHHIPGLGHIWTRGMRAAYQADVAVIVGFSLSDFDAMAQMQFAEVSKARFQEQRPLPVIVIDPFVNDATRDRFQRVFRCVRFEELRHEEFDWSGMC